ncbi:zinc metalloproteinase nas-4-like [Phlebotomus papatasi]|uniref:zinc metalloproteinase nas-4-like n=1 Tax=Phlebotomus papatasi TaxID=29031 RepID=UPI002483D1F2|nr:zinc metalloproteinase nas-4-like [Phlebotomus papatasi]
MLGTQLLLFFVCSVVLARKSYTDYNAVPDAEEIAGYYEGDMMLSTRQKIGLRSRNGLRSEKYHWPGAEVPYELSPKLSEHEKTYIRRALNIIQKVSCVKFRKKKDSDISYVYVNNLRGGCFSEVGFGLGKRMVNLHSSGLDTGCFRIGTIMHEFLHVLGFFHMQSAADRDDYVDIKWDNIKSTAKKNFRKYSYINVTHFGEIYDYNSVLHYGKNAFTSNGRPTIIPKDPKAIIGQRTHLSMGDIRRINKMYKCDIS